MHAAMAGMSGPYGPIQQPRVMMYPPPPVYSPPPMPYAMPPLTRPRRFSLRQIGGLVLGLIGVLLVVVALLGTWWYVGLTGFSGSIPITLPVNFGLFGGSANLFIIVLPLSYTGQWATVFLLTAVIVIAGLIMATTAVVLGFVSRNAGLRWASVGLAVGAFALLLVAPFTSWSRSPALRATTPCSSSRRAAPPSRAASPDSGDPRQSLRGPSPSKSRGVGGGGGTYRSSRQRSSLAPESSSLRRERSRPPATSQSRTHRPLVGRRRPPRPRNHPPRPHPRPRHRPNRSPLGRAAACPPPACVSHHPRCPPVETDSWMPRRWGARLCRAPWRASARL